MTELNFKQEIQPFIDSSGEFATLEGRDAGEQHISLKIQDALYGILSEYDSDDVEAKIKKEARTIIRNTDYVDTVNQIVVRRISDKDRKSQYDVKAKVRGAEDIDLILTNL